MGISNLGYIILPHAAPTWTSNLSCDRFKTPVFRYQHSTPFRFRTKPKATEKLGNTKGSKFPNLAKMCWRIEQYRQCTGCGEDFHYCTTDDAPCREATLRSPQKPVFGNCFEGIRRQKEIIWTFVCYECARRARARRESWDWPKQPWRAWVNLTKRRIVVQFLVSVTKERSQALC